MDSTLDLGSLLGMAIGIALSPIPIAAVILMLFSPKARVSGPMFVLGWILGLAIVGGVILLFGGGSAGTNDDPSVAALIVKIVLGILLLFVGVRQWRNRPRSEEEPEAPKWMRAIDSFGAGKSAGMGALLSGANPKNLALNAAAVVLIAQSSLGGGAEWGVFAVFVVLSSLTVILPVAYYFIAGRRAEKMLDSMKTWLMRNNAVIIGVLLLVFGVKLLADGILGLVS